jgi:MoaA/NifB/PqqE/SkfB family radical SAM enzyme
MKIRGITLCLDIVNACSVACPTCGTGIFPKRKGIMDIDLFRKILDKLVREAGKIRYLQMYAWGDPCLHPQLHVFLEECRSRKVPVIISTALQRTNCDWEKVVEARPKEIRFSFSGMGMMYYQHPASPSLFLEQLAKVCALPRHKETCWNMAFHLYRDNADQLRVAEELARFHKLNLVVFPAIFIPNDRTVEKDYTEKDLETISHLIETPEENMARIKRNTDFCMSQSKQICIDAKGMTYLCNVVYQDKFQVGPFLEMPLNDIRRRIKADPFCLKCKAIKAHLYHNIYDFTKPDPMVNAEKKYQ